MGTYLSPKLRHAENMHFFYFSKIQINFYFEPPFLSCGCDLISMFGIFYFLSLSQGTVCQFWGTYLKWRCLPRTEMSVFYVICVQSHVLRSILDLTESLAVEPRVLPLNFLSSDPGPGRPPHYLHDESLGLHLALPAQAKAL